jgi:hypothetical protein
MAFIRNFLVFSFLVSVGALQAQNLSYPQKKAALEAQIWLQFGIWIPELEKAQAVNELHTLVFESNLNEFFSKETGLVQRIIVKDVSYASRIPSDEKIANVTLLSDHTLVYPTKVSAIDLIASRLETERATLESIKELLADLKTNYPNVALIFERNSAHRTGSSNLSRHELLSNLYNSLNSSPALQAALASYEKFEVIDTDESHGWSGIKFWNWKSREGQDRPQAQLRVGREGLNNPALFLNAESLDKVLHIGFVLGFGVSPSYFMKSADFDAGLDSLCFTLTKTTHNTFATTESNLLKSKKTMPVAKTSFRKDV